MQRHRIFIAIILPGGIKKGLAEYQKKWPELPIRWTKPNNLHITLDFIGYIGNDELLDICKIVKEAAFKQPPFLINLTKICYGPPNDKKTPKMIWAIGEKSKEFASLRDNLERSLSNSENASFSAENRAFSSHITLGRIKQWEWKQIEPEERSIIDEDITLNFSANSIEVMESILKKKGPEYVILESHNLESEK